MPISQRRILQQGNYGEQFNRGIGVAKSHTPARSVGALTSHTQHGVIRKVPRISGLPMVKVDLCNPETGEIEHYMLYGFKIPGPPVVTTDSTVVTTDSTNITADQ
jgi:hypothetical protein